MITSGFHLRAIRPRKFHPSMNRLMMKPLWINAPRDQCPWYQTPWDDSPRMKPLMNQCPGRFMPLWIYARGINATGSIPRGINAPEMKPPRMKAPWTKAPYNFSEP